MSLLQRFSLIPIALVLLITVVSAPSVYSQENGGINELGLRILPAIVEVGAEPGTTVTKSIQIENLSSDTIGVTVDSRSLLPNDPEIDQSKRSLYDASSWVVPVQKDFLLVPDEQAVADVQFVIPPDAAPGGHYALVSFVPVAAVEDNTRVKAQPEVSSVVLVTIAGDISEEAYAEVDAPRITLNGQIDVSSQLSNIGNVHLLPAASATIRRTNGEIIDVVHQQPQLILPNTRKKISIPWDPEGSFGRFAVDFEYRFGTPTQTIKTSSQTIWILPPLGLFLSFIVIAVTATYVVFRVLRYVYRKFRSKKTIKKATKPRKQVRRDEKIHFDPRALDSVAKTGSLQNRPNRRRKPAPKKPSTDTAKKPRKIKVKF